MSGYVHFSSKTTEWETPAALFNALDEIFHFDLDVCATKGNAKCEQFFSPEDDGLKQSWEGRTCWMNPPYGREIVDWAEKAHGEAHDYNITVVALLPARTDTQWWHRFVMTADEIWFIKGRVKFVGSTSSAPFPSCIVVWRGISCMRPDKIVPTIRTWGWKEEGVV